MYMLNYTGYWIWFGGFGSLEKLFWVNFKSKHAFIYLCYVSPLIFERCTLCYTINYLSGLYRDSSSGVGWRSSRFLCTMCKCWRLSLCCKVGPFFISNHCAMLVWWFNKHFMCHFMTICISSAPWSLEMVLSWELYTIYWDLRNLLTKLLATHFLY